MRELSVVRLPVQNSAFTFFAALHFVSPRIKGRSMKILHHAHCWVYVDYATTPDDGRELLNKSDGEAQVLSRWDVGTLLCLVAIRTFGGAPICALTKESRSAALMPS